MMCARRERNNKVVMEPVFEVFDLFERPGLVARNVEAGLVHHRNRKRVEFALLHARGTGTNRLAEHLPEQRRGDG